MVIARSFWRKVLVTAVAAAAFVSLYEVTIFDSKYSTRQTVRTDVVLPAPGARLAFVATAYCKGLTTASGVAVQTGIAASDPTLLPIGSLVEIDSLDSRYDGIYAVLDTGPAIQGREVDIYMWSCYEALKFGRQSVYITVLRLGWNPRAMAPNFLDRLFRRPASEPEPLPSRPLPQIPSVGGRQK
jgi:3D (Asp-Asp-Asp) domain-containing protein